MLSREEAWLGGGGCGEAEPVGMTASLLVSLGFLVFSYPCLMVKGTSGTFLGFWGHVEGSLQPFCVPVGVRACWPLASSPRSLGVGVTPDVQLDLLEGEAATLSLHKPEAAAYPPFPPECDINSHPWVSPEPGRSLCSTVWAVPSSVLWGPRFLSLQSLLVFLWGPSFSEKRGPSSGCGGGSELPGLWLVSKRTWTFCAGGRWVGGAAGGLPCSGSSRVSWESCPLMAPGHSACGCVLLAPLVTWPNLKHTGLWATLGLPPKHRDPMLG